MKWTIPLFAILAGCAHTHSEVNIGTRIPHAGVQVHVEGGRGLAALFGLSILAAGIYEAERVRYFVNPFVTVSGNSPEAAPALAPDRKISEQDCTQPLDYTLGNIRCR